MGIFKVASLFCGLGGMDLGATGGILYLDKWYDRLSTEIVYAIDNNIDFISIYNTNFTVKAKLNDIIEECSSKIPDHDILIGGFPCQSFSIVAQNPKRLGNRDKRGLLFFEIKRVLQEKRPKAFIAENVKGILSANNGEAFPLILKEFQKAGYYIKYKVLNAADYGIPQKRERVFIIGIKNYEAYTAFNFPSTFTANNPITLSRVIDPEDSIEEKYYFSRRAVEGLKNAKHRKLMNKGRAQKLSQPCNTVGAHLAKVSLNSTDPVLLINGNWRMFTPREVARIQSFPDNFKLIGSKTVNYKALGNAVPPVLMWHVTKELIEALSKITND